MSTSNYQFPPSSPPPLSPPRLEDDAGPCFKPGLLPAFHLSSKHGSGDSGSLLPTKDSHLTSTSFRKGLLDSSPTRGNHNNSKLYNDRESNLKQSLDEIFFNAKSKPHNDDNLNFPNQKRGGEDRNKMESYPSPLPTSSVGERSSSPVQEQHSIKDVDIDTATKDRWFGFNSDSDNENHSSANRRILLPTPNTRPKLIQPTYASSEFKTQPFVVRNPLSNMKILNFVAHRAKTIKIGRSSKCCNLQINKKNKQISREHLVVKYVPASNKDKDNDQLGYFLIKCLGWNGVIVYFPPGVRQASSSLSSSASSSTFAAVNKSDNEQERMTDSNVKEQFLFKDQLIQVDAVAGIVIDIRGERVLVQIEPASNNSNSDDQNIDETEDENDIDSIFGNIKDKNQDCKQIATAQDGRESANGEDAGANRDDVVHCSNKPDTAPQSTKNMTGTQNVRQQSDLRPLDGSEQHSVVGPIKFVTSSTTNPKSSISRSVDSDKLGSEMHDTKRVKFTSSTTTTNINDKMNLQASSTIMEQGPISTINHNNDPSVVTDIGVSDAVPIAAEFNIASLKTIICNHLAFSRLSSTPISIIQGSSTSLTPVPKDQLRTVIKSIECVGVISRHGKDAAGKILEEEYYYIPENDNDEGRKFMLAQIKGHGGLRSCRKTHKQYYWKKPKI